MMSLSAVCDAILVTTTLLAACSVVKTFVLGPWDKIGPDPLDILGELSSEFGQLANRNLDRLKSLWFREEN